MKSLEETTKALEQATEEVRKVAEELGAVSSRLIKVKTVFGRLKAEVATSEAVRNLPNQAQREAEAELVLANHEKYKPLYDEYLDLESKVRRLYSMKDSATAIHATMIELNKNARALLMNGGK